MKNVSPLFLVLGIIVMFVIMTVSQIGLNMCFDEEVYLPLKFISLKLVAHIAGALVILFLVWREVANTKTSKMKRLGLIPPKISTLNILLLGIGSLGVSFLAEKITKYVLGVFSFPEPEKQTKFLQFLEQLTPEWGFVFILVIALAPGLVEEIAYRGYLQRGLLKKINPTLAITISAVLFGIAHIAPQEIIFTSIMGVWLGIVAWRTNSIWSTIFCHVLINGTNGFRMVGQQLWQFPEKLPHAYYYIVVIAFIYSVFILIGIGNAAKSRNLLKL